MRKTTIILLICALTAGFISCKKDEPADQSPKNEIKIGNESYTIFYASKMNGIGNYGVDDWETVSLNFKSAPDFQAGGAFADVTLELVYKINKGFYGNYICYDGLFAELSELEAQSIYHFFANGFSRCDYDVPMNYEQSKTYYIKSGTVTITDKGSSTYTIVCNLTATDNTPIECTYTGKLLENSDPPVWN